MTMYSRIELVHYALQVLHEEGGWCGGVVRGGVRGGGAGGWCGGWYPIDPVRQILAYLCFIGIDIFL